MSYRTFLKREGRFWRVDALLQKRCQWNYHFIHGNGGTTSTAWTDKMTHQWLKARRLYYEAYKLFHDDFDAGKLSVRSALSARVDAAYDSPVPPGRDYNLVVRRD